MIVEIEDRENLYQVIVASSRDVIQEFHMTAQNCPGNTAFMTYNQFESLNDIKYYGIYDVNLVGCIGIKKMSDVRYKIKHLAVLESHRHLGYGSELLEYAMKYIENEGGLKVQLGMIYENQKLYHWYLSKGFEVNKIKTYKSNAFKICYMEKIL